MWQGDEFPFEGRRRKCTESCVEKLQNAAKDNLDEKSWDSRLEGRQICGKIGCGRCLELHLLSFHPEETREEQLQLRGSQRQY